jgi:hypothetical protein
MSLALAVAIFAAAPAAPVTVTIPGGDALRSRIEQRDAELFRLEFESCDPARLRAMVAPDVEFYHDREGVVARSADDFMRDYAKTCEGWKAPDAWRARRELVAGTLRVDPVPGYGAIETGEHVFYERRGSGPEKMVGRALFTHLWVLGPDGAWRLSRVFSYGHRAVP